MRGPPAQQLTALTANVFNPQRGDQGWAEDEAEAPLLGMLTKSTVLTGQVHLSVHHAVPRPCPGVSLDTRRHVFLFLFLNNVKAQLVQTQY
jgi:hypothetical protein